MKTIAAPPDFPLGQRACVAKDGMNYVKFNEDGSIKFIALCNDRGGNCQLWGYFRDWPFVAWARFSHRHDWNDAFDRIQEFLTRISKE